MSTRYQRTAYNRFQRVQSQLHSIYAQAIAYAVTGDTLRDRLRELYALPDYQRLTRYYIGYIAGEQRQVEAGIWREHVVYMLGPASGPTRRVHTEWTEEMATLCRIPGALYAGHFWVDDQGQARLDRPFTEYKVSNPVREEGAV